MRLGKKITAPSKSVVTREENRIFSSTWSLERQNGRVIYEYMSGELSGAIRRHEVTEADFQAVYDGKMTDYDLLIKYGLS